MSSFIKTEFVTQLTCTSPFLYRDDPLKPFPYLPLLFFFLILPLVKGVLTQASNRLLVLKGAL